MTIKYLDSKRISFASTFRDDFTGGDLWVDNDSATGVSSNKLDFQMLSNGAPSTVSVHDLTSTDNEKWVLRFHSVNFSTLTASSNSFMSFCLSSGNQTLSNNGTQSAIIHRIGYMTGDKYLYAQDINNQAPNGVGADGSDAYTYLINTNYDIEIARTSATTYTVKSFIGGFDGTPVASTSGTCSSGLTGLRYIKIFGDNTHGSESGNFTGTIGKVEFFDGVITASYPTNVQDNSILVEKDTGKRYWRTPESTSDVTWDDSTDVGCSISGNTVTKTSGNSWTSGVAKTDEVISSSSGGTITMTSNAINTYIGLSNVATLNQQAKHWYDVKLGFNQNSIVENGAIVSPDTAFTRVTSDTMKITVSSAGLVKYYINDVLKHTSTITASGTYFGIFSAYNTNETLTATITTPATWTGNFDLTGLKTYYNFEQTSTTLTNMATSVGSTDSLGSSGDATASGTISTGVTGIVGNSWDFGGGKVTASHQFIPTSGDYTFSTWVNLDDISTAGEEILRHESPQFEVWRNTSGFNVMGASGIINIEAQSNLANGVWYNIVLVHSSSGDIIYLNGVSKSTADIISVPTGTAWYLGGRASSSEAINGKIDETTVWSRALSSSEVSGLYNSGRGKIVY